MCPSSLVNAMITGKAKALAFVLSLLLCIFAFTGCVEDTGSAETLDLLEAMKGQEETQTNDAPERYLVVVPSGCTGELSLLARDLANAIEQKTGVDCDYHYDSVLFDTDNKRVDILLGNTNRRISFETLNKLKNDDYVCKTVEGSIVLGGVSDTATVVAVKRFMEEVLPNATSQMLVSDGVGFEYRGEYRIKDVLLCGYDARDYVMVFSDAEAQNMCSSLRDLIAKQSGLCLEMKIGSASVNGQKEIFVDIDSAAMSASVKRVGEDVYLIGKDIYTLSVAISSFYNMLLESEKDGTLTLDIAGQLVFSCTDDAIDVASIVCDIPFMESSLTNISSLASAISNSGNDVVVFSKFDENVWKAVKEVMSSKYGVFELAFSDGTLLPVLYLKSSVSVKNGETVLIDGKETLKLTLEHTLSGELYTIYGFSSDAVSFQSINQTLKGDGGLAMATVIIPESRDNAIAPDKSVSTVYNGVSSYLDVDYRHLWLTVYPRLAYSNVQASRLNDSDYISFTVGNRYCAAYRQLAS